MFNRYDEFHQVYHNHSNYLFEETSNHKAHAQEALVNELDAMESAKASSNHSMHSHRAIKQSALVLTLTRISGSTRNTAIEYLVNIFDKLA